MMLELNDDQARVLAEALDGYIGELSTEIHHTDTKDYRDALKQRRDVLAGILETLRGTAA